PGKSHAWDEVIFVRLKVRQGQATRLSRLDRIRSNQRGYRIRRRGNRCGVFGYRNLVVGQVKVADNIVACGPRRLVDVTKTIIQSKTPTDLPTVLYIHL